MTTSTWQDQRDWIKSHVTMFDVLDMCGIDPPDRQGKIRSIYNPKERTPSLHIYPDHYYCYATGRGGDQIRFIQDYRNVSYKHAIEFLGRGGNPMARRIEIEMPDTLPDLTDKFNEMESGLNELAVKAATELMHRKWPGLTIADLHRFGNKIVNDEIWTPHTDWFGTTVRGIKTRSVYTGAKRAVYGSTFREALYRCGPLTDWEPVTLVEGESDCWVLTKLGIPNVLALPSGAGLWRDVWREQAGSRGMVFLALDNDQAGQDATDRITGSLETINVHVQHLEVPGGRVAEAVGQGWDPSEEIRLRALTTPRLSP